MNRFLLVTICLILIGAEKDFAQEVTTVSPFDKVIVSPHVKVTFTRGDKETVTVQSSTVGKDKIHIESNGSTLRVYLEGAKEVTKNEKSNDNGHKISLYKGTVLTVTIAYKTLKSLSVRGEEDILLKSKLEQEDFDLNLYGETTVELSEVQLNKMSTTMYGETKLLLKSGKITEQKFTAYGESKVEALGISNNVTRATLYGEAELNVNVSDRIRVTAYGEAKIGYKGNPEISKGLTIGGVKIYKLN